MINMLILQTIAWHFVTERFISKYGSELAVVLNKSEWHLDKIIVWYMYKFYQQNIFKNYGKKYWMPLAFLRITWQ